MSDTLTIVVDRCVACRRCEIACAVAHSPAKDLFGAIGQTDAPRSRIEVTEREGMPIVLVCVHCDDPACAAVCPAGAIEKCASGEVLLSEGRCVGCGACAIACHLGAPVPRRDGRAYITCDLCVSRGEAGRTTACAEACPTGAIRYGHGKKDQGAVTFVKPVQGKSAYLRLAGDAQFIRREIDD